MLARIVLSAALSIFPVSAALADGIPIEPGKWVITTTMEMPMLPAPRVQTNTQCMEEAEISPETMSAGEENSDCTFDAEVDGNTMRWSVECPAEDGLSRGDWEATTDGGTVTGGGVITATFQGQTMVMNMSWEGERVGDCD